MMLDWIVTIATAWTKINGFEQYLGGGIYTELDDCLSVRLQEK